MKEFVIATMALLWASLAGAQGHKISVQKYEVPQYPLIARAARISGDVKFTLEVAADGTVTSVKLVSGHLMLANALQESIKRWRFHCDDCKFGEEFKHQITFSFRIESQEDRKEPWMQFPSKVIIYAEPNYIFTVSGLAGIVRPWNFWLWKLVHPKSWRFHDYDHDL